MKRTRVQTSPDEALVLNGIKLGSREMLLSLLKLHVGVFADGLEKRWKAMKDETEASPDELGCPGTLKTHRGFYQAGVAKLKTGLYGLEAGFTRWADTGRLWAKLKTTVERFQRDAEAKFRPPAASKCDVFAIRIRLDQAMGVVRTMEESLAELDREIDRCRQATAAEVLNQPDP